jgi:hypothetical protein
MGSLRDLSRKRKEPIVKIKAVPLTIPFDTMSMEQNGYKATLWINDPSKIYLDLYRKEQPEATEEEKKEAIERFLG